MQTHDFLIIRRPLLSKDTLVNFHQTVNNCPDRFQSEILSLFSEPVMREAIFLASPDLSGQLLKACDLDTGTDREKLCYSLYKYLVRMCTRCTPFGLFAGCFTADIKATASSSIQLSGQSRTHFSMDSRILWELNSHLRQKDLIRDQLRYFPNTSMHQIDGCHRYIERQADGFVLLEAEANAYTQNLISAAKHGASIDYLIETLRTQNVNEGDALHLINEMIRAQILVSDFEPSAASSDWLQMMIDKLSSMINTDKDLECLRQFKSILKSSITADEKSDKLIEALRDYGLNPSGRHVLKADLYWDSAVCNIQQTVIDTLLAELEELAPLSKAPENSMLSEFAATFRQTYQDQEMPLLTVLDHESGIGYGNLSPVYTDDHSLLEGIEFPYPSKVQNKKESWLSDLKLRIYQDSINQKRSVIGLTKTELSQLPDHPTATGGGEGFCILGTMITENLRELDRGHFKFLPQAIGSPSGFNLLSRFCYGDRVLEGLSSQGIAREEFTGPDLVFAEINHLPDPKSGNIIARPLLRKYEIPYLSSSVATAENQILPNDLLISVTADHKVIIRSRRLGKRIIPRLTSAHNFTNGLPVYRFLCDVAHQDCSQVLYWDWDNLAGRNFLPRVEYKHWIISKATWNISLQNLTQIPADLITYQQRWAHIRQSQKIPELVQLVEGDNLFLIDVKSDFSIKILFDALKRDGKVRLTEYLDEPVRGLLQCLGQNYANEMVIPVLTKKEGLPKLTTTPKSISTEEQRYFFPGSEWLYLKIYCGSKTADQILIEKINPFCAQLISKKIITKWFFVRFQDPEPHLRLRFYQGNSTDFWVHMTRGFATLLDPYLICGQIKRMSLDTYERELERYAPIPYPLVEDFFYADSTLVLNLIQTGKDIDRWQLAIVGIDLLLAGLGYSCEQKSFLFTRLQEAFFSEFNGDQKLLVQLNDQYRKHQRTIKQILDPSQLQGIYPNIYVLFQERSKLVAHLQKNWHRSVDQVQLDQLAGSFIHMFINRLLRSNHRKQELLIYHFLKKHYTSEVLKKTSDNEKTKNNIKQNLQVTAK